MSSDRLYSYPAEKRIDPETGLSLYKDTPILELAAASDSFRRFKNPGGTVTYILDRNINYTNICSSGCEFCAFYEDPGSDDGYVLTEDVLFAKIDETLSLGGTQILLQGGLNPNLRLTYFERLFKKIKNSYKIHLHALSPPEIVYLSKLEAISFRAVIERLIDSGLDSIPGGGAEILVDRVRKQLSPDKCSAEEWLEVMRIAHNLGLRTTATMMFGHIETIEERVEHLEKIRKLQDETSGFTAFIPWTYQPGNDTLQVEKCSSIEYLRTLALSRLYLDNIQHIQVSWVTQGVKIAEVGLSYGADDFGSLMIEENVVKAAGADFRMTENEIASSITTMGFAPKRRDMFYNIIGEPLCLQK
jgi:cyclic dehypoxanthinyl futalosine synthase